MHETFHVRAKIIAYYGPLCRIFSRNELLTAKAMNESAKEYSCLLRKQLEYNLRFDPLVDRIFKLEK